MNRKPVPLKLDLRSHPDHVREAFVDWCATPSEAREPPVLKQWCEQNGVDRVTTWRWRQDPDFRQAVAERVRGWFVTEMPDVVRKVIDRAKEGSAKHAELIFRHIGEIWHGGEEERQNDDQGGMRVYEAVRSGELADALDRLANRMAQAAGVDLDALQKRMEAVQIEMVEKRPALPQGDVQEERVDPPKSENGQADTSESL